MLDRKLLSLRASSFHNEGENNHGLSEVQRFDAVGTLLHARRLCETLTNFVTSPADHHRGSSACDERSLLNVGLSVRVMPPCSRRLVQVRSTPVPSRVS